MQATHIQRAVRLYEMSRYDMAEQELRGALADDPADAIAHAWLAFCLVKRKEYQAATDEAEQAVHLAPDEPFVHYTLAHVMNERNRLPEAAAAISEALRLDPYDADYRGVLAAIRFRQERWADSLAAANEGLQIDPEHDTCTNLRAMALVKLGRSDQASDAIAQALRRDPENALTHANQGWTCLEQGQPKQALEHFREALRIDPEQTYARAGMVEALKARYFIYRWMLAYFLWMAKLSPQARWGVLIGGYFGYVMIGKLSAAAPALSPFLQPLLIAYIVFAVMTWVANPLMNLLLRLNPFGRYLLTRGEILTSNVVGVLVAASLACLIFATLGLPGWPLALWAALVFGLCIPAVASVHHCDAGWPRTAMILITMGLFGLGLLSLSPGAALVPGGDAIAVMLARPALAALKIFPFAAIGSQFAGIYLSQVMVRH